MTARDDYAKLHANTSGPHHQGQTSSEAQAALDEIDDLRRQEANTVDVNSDEGMLREAHDLLRCASFDHSPMRWVAADLVELIAARYPEPVDVIEHGNAPRSATAKDVEAWLKAEGYGVFSDVIADEARVTLQRDGSWIASFRHPVRGVALRKAYTYVADINDLETGNRCPVCLGSGNAWVYGSESPPCSKCGGSGFHPQGSTTTEAPE